MRFTAEGNTMFDDVYELTYNLLNAMNIDCDQQTGAIIYTDESTGVKKMIQMDGRKIVASIDPNNIHYAGPMDVTFDILNDIRLVSFMFGFYLDYEKKVNSGGMPYLSHFAEEAVQQFKAKKRSLGTFDVKFSALTVKMTSAESITSRYYHNKCLKFLDMIFILEGDDVDLSNFDIIDLDAEEEAYVNGKR